MLTRDNLTTGRGRSAAARAPKAPPPAAAAPPERWPTMPAPDLADLADTLSALAFDLEAGRLVAGNVAGLTALTLAADDLLGLAAALAPDPWPYMAARAAVGALPTGADASRPALATGPASRGDTHAAAA